MTDPTAVQGQPQQPSAEDLAAAQAAAILQQADGEQGRPQGPGAGQTPPEASAQQGAPGAPEQAQVLSGRHLVDWNGAPREVEIQEVVKTAAEADRLQQLQAATDASMQKLGAFQALNGVIERLTPEQQRAFTAVVANPALLERLNGSPPPRGDDDLPMDPTRAAAPPPHDAQLRPIVEGLSMLLKRAQTEDARTEQDTRAGAVNRTMDTFPVFRSDQGLDPQVQHQREALRGMAYDAVMLQLAMNPGANVDDLVAAAAARAIQVGGAPQQRAAPSGPNLVALQPGANGLQQPGQGGPLMELPQGRKPGEYMASGSLLQDALAAFGVR